MSHVAKRQPIAYGWWRNWRGFVVAFEESEETMDLIGLGAHKKNRSSGPLHGFPPEIEQRPVDIRMHRHGYKCPTGSLVLIETFVQ